MGWMEQDKRYGDRDTPAEICAKTLRWSNMSEAQHPTITKSVTTGEAVFFAVKFPKSFFAADLARGGQGWVDDYVAAGDGSVTIPMIFLYRNSSKTFAYKDQDEAVGPNVTAPSKAFLDALSPISDTSTSYARDWRARSIAALEAASRTRSKRNAIKEGDRIKTASKLMFATGERDEFIAVRMMRRGKERLLFRDDQGGLYRLKAEHIATAIVTPKAMIASAVLAAEGKPRAEASMPAQENEALRDPPDDAAAIGQEHDPAPAGDDDHAPSFV